MYYNYIVARQYEKSTIVLIKPIVFIKSMHYAANNVLPHRKKFFVARVIVISNFDDYELMFENAVIIETTFVRFDLLTVDNTYCRDYNSPIIIGAFF